MRTFVSSAVLAGMLVAGFHNGQVSAAAIITGDFLLAKAYDNNQCSGIATLIYLEDLAAVDATLDDCLATFDDAECTQSTEDTDIYTMFSCTSDLPTVMRTEYPDMDVLQTQDYTDEDCSTLGGIYLSPADDTDQTDTTCSDGSKYYRISSGTSTSASRTPGATRKTRTPAPTIHRVTFIPSPSRTKATIQYGDKNRNTYRIVVIVCGVVSSGILGWLGRKCCGAKKVEQTPVKPLAVQPAQ